MSSGDIDRRINSRLRAFLFSQIEETKDNVRLAYVLGARQKAGDILNQQELEFLQDQEIERRVLEKLEKMLDKVEHPASGRRVNLNHGLLGEREVFAVIRFFYLVRIAQQGFLPLIANAYPTLESEAIIYLADKLVAGSMGGISTIRHELQYSEMVKNEARNTARDIALKLYKEANEPVADGFNTTYKEIMQIAHCIAGQGMYEHQKKMGDLSATTLFEPSIASVPPVYVVLPHMSMVGDPKLSMPSVDPTLPIPGFLLSSKTADITPPAPKDLKEDTASSAWTDPNAIVDDTNTVPAKTDGVETSAAATSASEHLPDQTPVETHHHVDNPNAAHEEADSTPETDETATKDTEKTTKKKRNSSKKKSRRSKSDRSKRSESQASEDAAIHGEQYQDQESENDNSSTKPLENSVPQPQQQQQQQEEEEEDNEEDRFADADLLDDEHDILKQDNDDEAKDTTSMTQAQQQSPGNATTPAPQSDAGNNAAAPSPSQWQNFAATCHNDTYGSNTPFSPKSSARSSPKGGHR
ncbi:nuclear GTP-binding protein nug1 [Mucor velutinosus]|uniref:Nuclear GTP-binding protein nug1 n=1 Tax=Mucor velutinosus TaxID=708070 RepID=A0AAN7DPU6_9FUNG|nr:nuclear GTP-binding protein nug1 [Mucor velutinosus]